MLNQRITGAAVNRSLSELTGGLTSFSGLTVRERRTIPTRGRRRSGQVPRTVRHLFLALIRRVRASVIRRPLHNRPPT